MATPYYFGRLSDTDAPTTPKDSPFREFFVSCRHCKSVHVRPVAELDEEAGEMVLWLLCGRCRRREKICVR